MDSQLQNKIEKFMLMASLKGYYVDDNDWDFHDALETLEDIAQQRKQPEGHWIAAFMAFDQGITNGDINTYFEFKQEVANKAEEARRVEHEKNIPELNELKERNQFMEVYSSKYPTHYHFKFNKIVKNKPVEIRCRILSPQHGCYRLWYEWTDPKTNKRVNNKLEGSRYYIHGHPEWFPKWWKNHWNIKDQHLAMIFAYSMTKNFKGVWKNIVKPT